MNRLTHSVYWRSKLRGIRPAEIKELKDGTQTRLSNLEADRVTQKEYLDHENRLRFIEKYVWGAVGIIGLVNLIGFAYIISKLTNH